MTVHEVLVHMCAHAARSAKVNHQNAKATCGYAPRAVFKDLCRDRRNASSSGPSLRDPSFRKTSADGLLTCTPHTPAPILEELRSTACSVALVVLWMGLHQEKFPLLATTLQAAAGVSGPQKWALILPSSARVSLVTYTAVIAVRYPELDNVQNDLICFGNYLLGEQATSGGFLPLFWDAPSAYMHAATDIGSAVDWLQSQVELNSDENGCLAVLHNRNKMVATFGNSEWVTQSDGAVQSKSVTSCAGMTAHYVLLAQTKVGFLSGGRGRHMKELSENEVLAQLEEAYARATVALTRAQKLCIIMGPLDMRGLPGAATVIGCLKYGAGVCGVHDSNQAAEVFLKDGSLNDGPDDDAFLQSLRRPLKTARGAYPPVALAEIYQEFKSPLTMIRRLHLMVVDLDRSRSVSPQVYLDFMNCRGSLDPAGSLNTLPVPISGKECPFQTRYVFAYGMDNSDRPSYLLWPIRGGNGQFLLVDPWSGNYFDLEAAKFVKPIGIEHFFDAFSPEKKRPLKIDAAFFLLYAAWVRSRAERPSVSYTKVVMEVAWTGHNLQFTKTN